MKSISIPISAADRETIWTAGQPELYPENGEHVGFWVFLTGMLVRFALILIPALLAYRLLVMLRVAEERRGTDRDRALVAEMWVSGETTPHVL